MLKKILNSIIKPLNPIDVDIRTKEPVGPFGYVSRVKLISISFIKLEKVSFFYLLNLFKHIFIDLAKILYAPLILIVSFTNLRFVRVNYWQFGTFIQHSYFLKLKQNSEGKSKKFILYLPRGQVSNVTISLFVKRNLIVVENLVLCLILFPFFHSKYSSEDILNLDEHSRNSITYKLNKKKNTFKFFNKNEEKRYNKILFEKINKNKKRKIITINLRVGDFYNDFKSHRNVEVKTYFKCLNYLVEKNYIIISFLPKKIFFNYLKKMILFIEDLNFGSKQNQMEIFILKSSYFFITTNFGPKNLCQAFKVPCLITNLFPFGNIIPYNSNDITIPKIISKKNKKLTLNEILNQNILFSFPNSSYKVSNNTSDDILNGCFDMLKNLKNKKKVKTRVKIINKKIPCYEGKGTISKSFIKKNNFFIN